MKNYYDIIIVGGGLVGTSIAIALSGHGFCVALIDEPSHQPMGAQDRAIVLSDTSRKIFQSLNIWPSLLPKVCPIKHIHVSQRNGFGSTQMSAEKERLFALGYVVSAHSINSALYDRLAQTSVTHMAGKFLSLESIGDESEIRCEINGESTTLRAKLVIAADGQHSSVRNQQNIAANTFDYQHKAIICKIALNRDHHHIAYERFTSLGSMAMLPLNERHVSLIWSIPQSQSNRMLALNDADFLKTIQDCFGYRLGKFLECTARKAIPLQLIMTEQQIKSRLVLVGNAAHTLHPIAGQGLNLALRDISVLAEVILLAFKQGEDIGSLDILRRYFQRRRQDQLFITNFTHHLVDIFSKQHFPLVLLRDMGLVLIEMLSPLKHYLIEKALGKTGRLPRLACGLPIG